MNKITFNMKFKLLYIRQILILVFLIICYQQRAVSQGTDISITKNPSLFAELSLGPSRSNIINEGTLSVSNMVSSKQNSFLGFLEIGYFFSTHFGLSSGIGFTSAKTQLTLDAYQNKLNAVDSENESYERRVNGSDITEVQKVGFLCVPLSIILRLPFNDKAAFFIQTGVGVSVPLSKTYNSTGTFTYKGYYPAYNVLLENLPAYGFSSNKNVTANGELELNHLSFNAAVSGGVDFFIKENIQIAGAVCYNKTLSNISNYSTPDKFQLSTDVDQINSLMGGSTKASVQLISLKVSLRYYLK